LGSETPLQNMMKLAREFGPIFRLSFPGASIQVISSYELVADACDETRFEKKVTQALMNLRALGGEGLFTVESDDPKWGKAHRLLMPAFSPAAMRNYHDGMLDVADQMLTRWARFGPETDIHVSDDMTRLTLDTIALCGFSFRFNSFYQTQLHPFVDSMVRALEEAGNRTRRLPVQTQLMLRTRRQFEADTGYLRELTQQLIAKRRALRPDEAPRDILSLMLEAVDPPRFHLSEPEPYKLRIRETLTLKPEGFKLRVRERKPASRPPAPRPTPRPTPRPEVPVSQPSEKAAAHGTPLLLLYGSNSGASEAFARRIASDGLARGYSARVAPLDDYTGKLPREGAVFIVTASYNGKPPDNARAFHTWVSHLPEGSLKGVRYAVFGCGNKDWGDTYQAVPRHLDERLSAAGPRGSSRAARRMREPISSGSSSTGTRPSGRAWALRSACPRVRWRPVRSSRWRWCRRPAWSW
jgi:flavodoxin